MHPSCPNCGDSNSWGGGASANLSVVCGNCNHQVSLSWFLSAPASAAAAPVANGFSTHKWDYTTSVAICTVCLVDANNPGHSVPCPQVPMDWPATGSSSYPDCSCGVNDWTIVQTSAFVCNACNRQYTLPQLQALAPMGIKSFKQISIGGLPPPLGTWGSWKTKILDDEDLAVPVPTKPPPERCTQCNRELSKEMDAYYGKDEREAKKCRPCRTNKPF